MGKTKEIALGAVNLIGTGKNHWYQVENGRVAQCIQSWSLTCR